MDVMGRLKSTVLTSNNESYRYTGSLL